jgi:hypothetical protein
LSLHRLFYGRRVQRPILSRLSTISQRSAASCIFAGDLLIILAALEPIQELVESDESVVIP